MRKILTSKELKTKYRKEFSQSYKNYYPALYLAKEGFVRNKCIKCNKYFWNSNQNQKVCGDAACSGGFRFLDNPPARNKLDYISVWKEFSKMFKKFGYTPIKRYPTVARWRDDIYFVEASIDDFIPFVVSGEVKPPANPLIVPQLCLRFNDIDNVGLSMAHNTIFSMIGQHEFVEPKDWNQEEVFKHIHSWLKMGLALQNNEITFHEDVWAGSNRYGPCMEFFSGGVELGNQVYMMYEQTPSGNKELNLKVLDMGMGQERNAWFSQGSATIYDATFPKVMKGLYDTSGLQIDKKLMTKFIPCAGYLNVDEAKDLEVAWKQIAKNVGINANELKKKIIPLSCLYSIGEHSRALLVALSDGGLPSNVSGGYNLRILARRCFEFIERYKWKINLFDICQEHAKELKQQYPELSENLDEVKKILEVEKNKYSVNKEKAKAIISKIVSEKQKIGVGKLIELYDSNGIAPELIAKELKIKVPDNFYALVAERQEKKEQEHQTKKEEVLDLNGLPETKAFYFDNYKLNEFKGKVLRVVGNKVVLDQTVFYPTSGGQLHDIGTLNNFRVVDVFKQGKIIVHVLGENHNLKAGDSVKGGIDFERRLQLAQHHTSTHIINAAARKVLGNHINQAGAKKTVEKAHIDITHYQSLREEELKKIECEANKIIKQNIPVKKSFIPRDIAEKKYGFVIYQGGAPIGKELRIVEIIGVDVEACGGTHLNNTKEAEMIKILKSTKISDSIVRIEFVAGRKAFEEENKEVNIVRELASLLRCDKKQVPGRLQELFIVWKDVIKKGRTLSRFGLVSKEVYEGDVIEKAAEILKTQPEHLVNTVKRFLKEIDEKIKK